MLIWITKGLSWECLDVISCFDEFVIYHIPRHVDNGANILTHQTSGYMIRKDQFHIKRPMFVDTKVHSLDKPVQPVFETGLTGFHDRSDRLWNRFNQFFLWKTLSRLWWPKIIMQPRFSAWRKSFIDYLQSSSCIKVWHFTFNYILMMSYAIKMPKVLCWVTLC